MRKRKTSTGLLRYLLMKGYNRMEKLDVIFSCILTLTTQGLYSRQKSGKLCVQLCVAKNIFLQTNLCAVKLEKPPDFQGLFHCNFCRIYLCLISRDFADQSTSVKYWWIIHRWLVESAKRVSLFSLPLKHVYLCLCLAFKMQL